MIFHPKTKKSQIMSRINQKVKNGKKNYFDHLLGGGCTLRLVKIHNMSAFRIFPTFVQRNPLNVSL